MSIQVYLGIFIIIMLLVPIVSTIITSRTIKREYEQRVKIDISLEKMRELEKNLEHFFEENNILEGQSIWEIAKILKISLDNCENRISGQAQLSEPDKNGNMIVTLRKGLTNEEINFALAHECAHLINNDPLPVARPSGQNKPEVEQIADYTAAALLMPCDSVYKYLVENRYKEVSSRERVILIRKLCQTYKVSEVIALRRVKEVYALKQM